ncbi:MAG: aspartyl/asparaginyl beta-hydroxylase domain-containing protein [Phormidesmis sp.]
MTILTIEDNEIAEVAQIVLTGNNTPPSSVPCLGPTYISLRQNGQRQRAHWNYSFDLTNTLQAALPQVTSRTDTLEICFTHRYRSISAAQLRKTFSNVHVGIRGIEIQYKDRMVRYSPTTMLARNLTFTKVFERFLEDNDLSASELFQQGMVQAFEARQVLISLGTTVKAVTLHRGNHIVPLASLSTETLGTMTTSMGQWLMRQVKGDGRLMYKYFPSRGKEATSNNLIRQFMATLCLIRYAKMTGRADHQILVTLNLNYNLDQFYQTEGESDEALGFVIYNGKAKLGAIALAALAILEYCDLLSLDVQTSAYGKYFQTLCRTLEHLWQPDGSFRTFLKPSDRNDNQNFYPGEALLFWAHLYQQTQDADLLEHCRKSVRFYQSWHQHHRNPAFIPWHTQAYTLLYQETGDRDFLNPIFEMTDWLLAMQQWESAPYSDVAGRFYKPKQPQYGPPHASSTGVYLEGLADAYQLAIESEDYPRAQRYQQVIWRGLRSIRQLQFKSKADLFYISQISPVHGGLRTTVYNNVIRVDNVQHCLMALIKLSQIPGFLPHSASDSSLSAQMPSQQPEQPATAQGISASEDFPAPKRILTATSGDSLKYFRLLLPQVNIQPFLTEIATNEHLWLKDTSRQQKVTVQRETNAIYLRSAVKPFPIGESNGNNVHASRQTKLAQHFPKIMAWLNNFSEQRKGELGRATIVRLAPKGRVYRHIDKGDYYRIRDRYHLVLHSPAGSMLGAGDEWIRMQPGEFWWFDNNAPHEAYNESDDWRIHLIFDVLPYPLQAISMKPTSTMVL